MNPFEQAVARADEALPINYRNEDATTLLDALAIERVDAKQVAPTPGGRVGDITPFSRSRTSNWVARMGGLHPYIRQVAHALMRKGDIDESSAIHRAVGILENWAHGHGGHVSPKVRVAAAAAIADFHAKAKLSRVATAGKRAARAAKWDSPEDIANKGEIVDGVEYKEVGVKGLTVDSEDQGIVTALVSVTGLVDNVNDVIHPGAYEKSLKQRVPKGVWGHDWGTPISKTLEAKELLPGDPELPARLDTGEPWPDNAGALKVKMQFNLDTDTGSRAFKNVKFYGNDQCWSIGYVVPTGGAEIDSKSGQRHIHNMNVYEYSPVLFGAMPIAKTLDVKTAQEAWRQFSDIEGKAGKISDTPWSSFSNSDYDDDQYARACIVDRGPDAGPAKQRYSLPVKEPDGTLNRNGVHSAAAALAGARGGLKGLSSQDKSAAARKLVSLYRQLGEDPPDNLTSMASGKTDDVFFDVETKKEFTAERRAKLAERGHALPGGGYPIENASDLRNAIRAIGRATNREAVMAHIKKRAKALGLTDMLPDDWKSEDTWPEYKQDDGGGVDTEPADSDYDGDGDYDTNEGQTIQVSASDLMILASLGDEISDIVERLTGRGGFEEEGEEGEGAEPPGVDEDMWNKSESWYEPYEEKAARRRVHELSTRVSVPKKFTVKRVGPGEHRVYGDGKILGIVHKTDRGWVHHSPGYTSRPYSSHHAAIHGLKNSSRALREWGKPTRHEPSGEEMQRRSAEAFGRGARYLGTPFGGKSDYYDDAEYKAEVAGADSFTDIIDSLAEFRDDIGNYDDISDLAAQYDDKLDNGDVDGALQVAQQFVDQLESAMTNATDQDTQSAITEAVQEIAGLLETVGGDQGDYEEGEGEDEGGYGKEEGEYESEGESDQGTEPEGEKVVALEIDTKALDAMHQLVK